MTEAMLVDLQTSVQDRSAFDALADYFTLGEAFLGFLQRMQPTRIVSPSHHNYVFYQYGETHGYKITRPSDEAVAWRIVAARSSPTMRTLERSKEIRPHGRQTE